MIADPGSLPFPRCGPQPWLGTVKNSVPTEYMKKTPDSSAPTSFLLLDWVHGYTVDGAYNNVRYVGPST